MGIDRDEFLVLLTRARVNYAQLGRRIGRSERTVSTWGGRKQGGVPDRYEAVVRDALAVPGEAANPLAAYSDYALLDELARRLRATPYHEETTTKTGAETNQDEPRDIHSGSGPRRIRGRGPADTLKDPSCSTSRRAQSATTDGPST